MPKCKILNLVTAVGKIHIKSSKIGDTPKGPLTKMWCNKSQVDNQNIYIDRYISHKYNYFSEHIPQQIMYTIAWNSHVGEKT